MIAVKLKIVHTHNRVTFRTNGHPTETTVAMMHLRLAKYLKGSRPHLFIRADNQVSNGILPGDCIGQTVCVGSFRRPAAADALFDRCAFRFIPGTCVSEDRFFNIFYLFHTAKIAGARRKKVQLVDDFKIVFVAARTIPSTVITILFLIHSKRPAMINLALLAGIIELPDLFIGLST